MSSTKLSKFGDFSILMVAFVWIFETSAVAPILGSLGQDFPGTSNFKLQLVCTMPFITSIIFSIVSGILAQYIDKKIIILIGLFIYGTTGIIPAFLNSIDQILIIRLITGIGVGLVLPMPNVIITEHYDGVRRERMLGLATSLANVANVLNSVLIGFILTLGWRNCFYAFSLVLVIMVINIIGLPKCPPAKQNVQKAHPKGQKIPIVVFVLALFMMLNWAIFQINILSMAFFMTSEKIGLPWMIGIAIAIPGFGSIFSGALFPELYSKLKNYLVFVGLLIYTLGYVVLYKTHSFPSIVVANILEGFGSGLLVPYILYLTSKKVGQEQKDVAFGIVSSCIHLGILASPFLQVGITLLSNNSSLRFQYFVSAIFLGIATIISLLLGNKSKISEEDINIVV